MRPRLAALAALSFRLVLAGLAAVLLLSPAWAQDRVQTRAWPHPGFARIVFDWPAPVGYEARIEGASLVVGFDRSLSSDFARMVRFLPEYVSGASLSEDGKTLTVALTGAFGLRTSTSNTSIVIDLLLKPGNSRGEAKAVEPPPEPEKVGVRFGEHANFTRVVFDWTRDVDYAVEKTGSALTIRFDRDARFDLRRLADGEFPLVNTASSKSGNGRAVVELRVADATRFRHFRDGTKVVVDILRGAEQAAAAPARKAPRKPAVLKAAPGAPSQAAVPPPPPPRQKPEVARDPAAPRPVASAARRRADEPASAVPAVPQKPVEIVRIPRPPKVAPGLGEPTKLSPGEAKIDRDAQRAPVGSSSSGVRVSVAAGPAGPILAFEWSQPVAAAVFERAGFYWVVFDRVERAEILPIPPEVSDSVFLAEVVPNDFGTVFRFKINPALRASVSRDEEVWRVDFSARGEGPAEPIQVLRENTSGGGPRVFLPIEKIGRRVDLNDPEVGDIVHVIPVLTGGQGVPVERGFVEFNLLATAQGVVVSPRADDIAVRPLRNGVEISGPDGLIMSALPEEGETESARRAPGPSEPLDATSGGPPEASSEDSPEGAPEAAPPRQRRGGLRNFGVSLFQYAEWRGDPEGPFSDTRKHLNLSLANAPRGAQNAALWNLAKFYFAYGMAADSLGLTDIILQNNPSAIDDQAFKAVRGASFYLMGRFPEAERDLLDPALGLDSGAALWRGAVFAAREDWAAARQEFEVANLNDEDVPPIFRTHFQLLAARASMLAGDAEDTEFVLRGVTEETARPEQLSEADLIRGQLQLGLGLNEEAVKTFRHVAEAKIRPTWPWAQLAYTDARLELGEVSTEEAIDELEGLRHSWRGGEFEFRLLNRLSELYLQENQFRNALSTMRETVSNFNGRPGSKEITTQMNDLFRDLFLEHGADAVAPVSALALYFDFRELTPVGSDGDAMIRLLADRLVEVDLLGRAAQLIQHQVTFRLKGEEKSRVGTKLAAIYLLDRQYGKAIEALRESRWRALPKEVRNERKYLRAQAHIGLTEFEVALKLLNRDDSAVAETLRAEIYWTTSAWNDAADAFAAVLDARQRSDVLSTREQQQVMQMTVALALSEQRERIATVREQYKSLMDGTPEADAFEVLTGEIDSASTSFRTVASKIAQIGTLESFMARYRSSLAEDGVGALN